MKLPHFCWLLLELSYEVIFTYCICNCLVLFKDVQSMHIQWITGIESIKLLSNKLGTIRLWVKNSFEFSKYFLKGNVRIPWLLLLQVVVSYCHLLANQLLLLLLWPMPTLAEEEQVYVSPQAWLWSIFGSFLYCITKYI